MRKRRILNNLTSIISIFLKEKSCPLLMISSIKRFSAVEKDFLVKKRLFALFG